MSLIRVFAFVLLTLFVTGCQSTPEPTEQSQQNIDPNVLGAPSGYVGQSNIIPGSQEDLIENVGDRVFFDFDSAVLSNQAQDVLGKQAQWLNQYPHVTITVEGHCDERGTREYNLALGERRAAAVRNYLVSSNVSPSRVSIISYGKERPVALGSNERAWAQNRRGVVTVN